MDDKRRIFVEFLLGIAVYFTGLLMGSLLISVASVVGPFPKMSTSEWSFWELLLIECTGISLAFFVATRALPLSSRGDTTRLGWGFLNPIAGCIATAIFFTTFVTSHLLQRGFAQAASDMQETAALDVMLVAVLSTLPAVLGYRLGATHPDRRDSGTRQS